VALDETTKGDWTGKYGSSGYNFPVSGALASPYANVDVSDARIKIWSAITRDSRAVKKAGASLPLRTAAAWYGDSFSIDVDVTDDQTHRISLYALDWDGKGRSERIDVVDATTGIVLDSRTVSSFDGGVYLTWEVKGDVRFVINRVAGDDAVISGIFFD
jgi:hypothetical protein